MPDFKANLIRELFVLKNRNKPSDDPQTARGNRLAITCFDAKNENAGNFVIRAQNIHTTLRLAARVARHWYDHGEMAQTGPNRFNWQHEYNETVKDYEDKWNADCWACIYQNGKLVFAAQPPEKSQLFDIIEQVYAHKKGDYKDIALAAETMFKQAGKNISLTYDGDIAMELMGTDSAVKNRITYRDTQGRNKLELLMRQKDLKHIKGKASPLKLSECLSVAAVIFEGFQLGFVVGRTNYLLACGQLTLADDEAKQTDHAIKRIIRLDQSINDLTTKYHLAFKPKPNFQANINKIENFFREQARTF